MKLTKQQRKQKIRELKLEQKNKLLREQGWCVDNHRRDIIGDPYIHVGLQAKAVIHDYTYNIRMCVYCGGLYDDSNIFIVGIG